MCICLFMICCFNLITEWELKFKETHFLIDEEVSRCREALSNNLNGLLAKEELLGIFIPDNKHDICVRNSSLKIRFAVRNISSGPNINTVSDIVQRCLDQNQLHSITVKRGRKVSRWVKVPNLSISAQLSVFLVICHLLIKICSFISSFKYDERLKKFTQIDERLKKFTKGWQLWCKN